MSDEYDWRREEADPEVLADLELRARTQAQRGHRREANANLTYARPVFVAAWKCRAPRCDERIPVTADAIERLAAFNAELARRDERPIDADSVLVCTEHTRLLVLDRAEKLGELHKRIAKGVRQLKEAADPLLLPDVIAELRRDHHPDVDGLLAALAGRKPSKRKAKL